MSRIKVSKDNLVLLDMEVAQLMSYLWLAQGRAPEPPYVIETHALSSIEITLVAPEEDDPC